MWLLIVLIVLVVLALLALVVLAAVAAVAAAVAVVAHLLPWILILAGAWLLIRALRGPDQHQPAARGAGPGAPRQPRPWTGPVQGTAPSPAASASAPRAPAQRSRELPIDLQVKVEQIRRKAEMLLGFAERFPPFSQDLYIVRQTAADYLPRTIEAYLALPGEGDPVVGPGGRTALDELRSQLQLLDARLDDIAQDLQRQDVGRLLANRRFLEERFGLRDRPGRADLAGDATDAA